MIKELSKNNKTEIIHHIYDNHKKNPENKDYAGCSCKSSYVQIKV